MDDLTYLTLCVYDEAAGEPNDGRAAVARVVLNRKHKLVQSDGTMRGTVLALYQFSGFYFEMINGHYTKVCTDIECADARAAKKLIEYQKHNESWNTVNNICAEVMNGTYVGTDAYNHLTPDTILYYNPSVTSHHPAWALPNKFVVKIGRHFFYNH